VHGLVVAKKKIETQAEKGLAGEDRSSVYTYVA